MRVRCVDAHGAEKYLKEGQVYEVVYGDSYGGFYVFRGTDGVWGAARFEVIE